MGNVVGQGQDPAVGVERGRDAVVLLPLYNDMTGAEQDRVIGALRRLAESARAG